MASRLPKRNRWSMRACSCSWPLPAATGPRCGWTIGAIPGPAITRTVEPALLANYGRRWYLLVWDCERQDWRSLRADRIDQAVATGARFAPRALPEEPLQLLRKAIGEAPFPCRARVRLAGTVEALAARIPPWLGALQADVAGRWSRTLLAGSWRAEHAGAGSQPVVAGPAVRCDCASRSPLHLDAGAGRVAHAVGPPAALRAVNTP